MADNGDILRIRGLTKRFPGVLAVNDIDMVVRAGEAHVLVGENGAGKSTIVKILSGVYQPDAGEIQYKGEPYTPLTPLDALQAGIHVVYQEFNLLTNLSVAENVFFGRLPTKGGVVDYRALYANTEKILDEVGLDVPPDTLVENLGVAQMQLIEIARAISTESEVLIMDEPTATLTSKEIAVLFTIIKKLIDKGVTVIYISHRLAEIFDIGNRVTVLRNGEVVATKLLTDVTIPELVHMMVGREIKEQYLFRDDVVPGDVMFEARDIVYSDGDHRISFSVRRGEILGVAGLVGSGRTETMRAIFGADQKARGRVCLGGREITIRHPRDAVRQGIGFLTEDRKAQGLILEMPCRVNITITDTARISRAGVLLRDVERTASQRLVDDLDIRTPSVDQIVENLSGGNQQKIVVAKWLFRDMKFLIFDEPTRGIDVGAKHEMYSLLWDLAEQGKGIVVVSSDLPELIGICHRIIVFSKGKLVGELDRAEFDQEEILSLAYSEHIRGDGAQVGSIRSQIT